MNSKTHQRLQTKYVYSTVYLYINLSMELEVL